MEMDFMKDMGFRLLEQKEEILVTENYGYCGGYIYKYEHSQHYKINCDIYIYKDVCIGNESVGTFDWYCNLFRDWSGSREMPMSELKESIQEVFENELKVLSMED